MAVISKGQKKSYTEEVKRDGVATQKELDDAITLLQQQIQEAGGDIEGWDDEISPLSVGLEGDNEVSPLWADTGNGFWGWHFSCMNTNEAAADFHCRHRIKDGGKMYPHVHWMPMSHSQGTVVWEFEYVKAKGYGQNEILTGTPDKLTVKTTAKGLIGEHMISEVNDAQAFFTPETDSIIRMKVRRLAEHPEDTFLGTVVGLFLDIHFEVDKNSTIGRNPDFNTPTGEVL